jgi:rubrerythrin
MSRCEFLNCADSGFRKGCCNNDTILDLLENGEKEWAMAIYHVEEILKKIVEWEEWLEKFYVLMLKVSKNERSRKTVCVLQRNHEKNLNILRNIHPQDYHPSEFIKNAPDYHSADVIPHYELQESSSPEEIFEKIIGYEEKLLDFYRHLRQLAVYQKTKDLFDMLINFKISQIKEIKGIMDSYDLAV